MNTSFTIPAAIVIAGGLIAGSVYLVNKPPSAPTQAAAVAGQEESIDLDPVTATDHIRGNPNAPIIIVEYSDTECPYCKQFHQTMKMLMDDYGKDGKLAWVYRNFPIDQLHSNASKQAEVLECAAELGGEAGFWTYTDKLYEITPSNNRFDMTQLPQVAEDVGLDRTAFASCLESGRMKARVEAGIESARKAGARGTPYSVIIMNGEAITPAINGAVPYASMKSSIATLLARMENNDPNTDIVPVQTP